METETLEQKIRRLIKEQQKLCSEKDTLAKIGAFGDAGKMQERIDALNAEIMANCAKYKQEGKDDEKAKA